MKVYLSGKMAGVPKFNFPAFDKAAEQLRQAGHEVFNPAEKDRELYGHDFAEICDGNFEESVRRGFNLRQTFFLDCEYICKEAEAIAMLPGWEDSGGARAEHALAHVLRLKFIYL